MMKNIEVVAAIISSRDQIFATKRGYGEFKGWWEFPGGKIEEGESLEEALHREIREELDAQITIDTLFETIEWDYPDFHLTMHCYLCTLENDNYTLKEHEDARWIEADYLFSVDWLPADLEVVRRLSLLHAVRARHSIRRYIDKPLSQEVIDKLNEKIRECNEKGNLHIQLVVNEKRGFNGIMAYGSFSGVSNYIVMAGAKSDTLGQRIGYYGEQIVLYAQQLGLGTCWAGISYRKIKDAYTLAPEEKISCMISIGYPDEGGRVLKRKTPEMVSNISVDSPGWFALGVKAALKAPTAVNQQKFFFELMPQPSGCKPIVKAKALPSMVGYTKIDLGIAMYHFEIGAGLSNFEWSDTPFRI